ncbi:lipopolysaccharide biosynthesis protein [Campylobacter hominis]
MSDLKKFVKSSGIYFLGSILSKLIAFFMLPIYTTYLNPAEFGEYDLSLAYITFFTYLFYPDIWVGVMKYILYKKDIANIKEEDKNFKIISTGFFLFFICTIFYLLFFFIFLFYKNVNFPNLLIFLGFLISLQTMYAYILRALDKNFYFVISGIIETIGYSIIAFILLYFLNLKYESLLIGAIFGKTIAIFVMEKYNPVTKYIRFNNFDFLFFKTLFKFSFPLIFNSLAWWFAAIYGKILISSELSLDENGYYAIALKFSLILSLVIMCFRMAWQEISFSKNLDKKNNSIFYSNVCYQYLKFMIISVILILPIIKLLFPFFINSKFIESLNYIPGTLFGAIIYGFNDFLTSIVNTINKNKYLCLCTITGAIINVILLNIFISKFGVMAVIYSYIICYIVICFLIIVVINRSFKIKLNFLKIASLICCFYVQNNIFTNMSLSVNMLSFSMFLFLTLFLYRCELKILCKNMLNSLKRKKNEL